MSASEIPIACTLDARSFQERIGAIKVLFGRALRASRRDGTRLHLTFDAAARAEVEDLVRQEKTCCAFLDFKLEDGKQGIELTITAPPGAKGADALLAPFLPDEGGASCGCSRA
jgi:hypothetical protein